MYSLNKLAQVSVLSTEHNKGSARIEWLKKTRVGCKRALKLSKAFLTGRAESMRHRGTYEWLSNKPNSAQKWWQKSLGIAEELGMRYQQGLTHLEMGRRLKDKAHLNQAEKIFTEIGAEFELAETKEFLHVLSG
jgi:hypothetical protein